MSDSEHSIATMPMHVIKVLYQEMLIKTSLGVMTPWWSDSLVKVILTFRWQDTWFTVDYGAFWSKLELLDSMLGFLVLSYQEPQEFCHRCLMSLWAMQGKWYHCLFYIKNLLIFSLDSCICLHVRQNMKNSISLKPNPEIWQHFRICKKHYIAQYWILNKFQIKDILGVS